MVDKETWKPVVGFEGVYEVSNLGRVRSLDRIVLHRVKGRILKPGVGSHGYKTVALTSRNSQTVHSLVLAAFVSPRPRGYQIRHLDGDRLNISLTNLAYGTRAENSADTKRHGRRMMGTDYPHAKLTPEKVRRIRQLKSRISQSTLARMFKVSPAAIQAVHDGRTWKHV